MFKKILLKIVLLISIMILSSAKKPSPELEITPNITGSIKNKSGVSVYAKPPRIFDFSYIDKKIYGIYEINPEIKAKDFFLKRLPYIINLDVYGKTLKGNIELEKISSFFNISINLKFDNKDINGEIQQINNTKFKLKLKSPDFDIISDFYMDYTNANHDVSMNNEKCIWNIKGKMKETLFNFSFDKNSSIIGYFKYEKGNKNYYLFANKENINNFLLFLIAEMTRITISDFRDIERRENR